MWPFVWGMRWEAAVRNEGKPKGTTTTMVPRRPIMVRQPTTTATTGNNPVAERELAGDENV